VRLSVASEEELEKAARRIIDFAGEKKIWLFYGDMGSGKTTLIKAISKVYGIEDMVQSPTFSIVNEYRNTDDIIFYHFDFYRIKNETEALDVGVDEYFESQAYCFIEWPEKIPNLIPDDYLSIKIGINTETSRVINLNHHDR
jgi:tRNA threonylcarbamoyladenosine biosynthesis protein TsaE